MLVQTTDRMLRERKWTNLRIIRYGKIRGPSSLPQTYIRKITTDTYLRTLHIGNQLLHRRHIPSGASHVQWSGSLAVLGCHVDGLAPHPPPVCLQQQPDQLTTGGLCFRGTFLLHIDVGAPWEVACCKVQWGKTLLAANIWIWRQDRRRKMSAC